MKKLTIQLEPELHQAFKVYCAATGIEMSKLIREILEAHLEKQAKRGKKK